MTVTNTSRLDVKKFPALDDFRLLAVILVVANHTRSADGEFLWVLTVLRRVSVPFFIMVSGYFLARGNWRSTGKFLTKTAMLYGVGVLLYLPLNCYAGQLSPDFFRRVIFDGSFYHLWYLPALLLGTPIAYYLSRFKPQAAIPIAGALYLIGLGGESYYGLVSGIPVISAFYNGIFQVFDYTRNGLFYVPLFLLLGAAGIVFSRRTSVIGLLCSLAALIVEALLLHRSGIQRHDSMYFFFPVLAQLQDHRQNSADERQHRPQVCVRVGGAAAHQYREHIRHHQGWPEAQRQSALHHPSDSAGAGPVLRTAVGADRCGG